MDSLAHKDKEEHMPNIDPVLSTGLRGLDQTLRGLMPGDNLVWRVGAIDDYFPFVQAACDQAARTRQTTIYFRFATHKPLIEEGDGITVRHLHPERGFDAFINDIHEVINQSRHRALYIFDCLSELAVDWCSDRMLGNFFMLTCPHLYDVGAIAYFALLRDNHSFHATGPITSTTQVLIDVYRHDEKSYVQPIKVQHRNSPTMYMLHAMEGDDFAPVVHSITTALILEDVPWNRSDTANYHLGFWSRTFSRAEAIQANLDRGEAPPPDLDEFVGQLQHMMIAKDPRILKLAEGYFSLKHIVNIRRRMIGTGLIGGKSTGMLLARAILEKDSPECHDLLEPHDSFFVGSDVFCTYLVQNGCWWNRQVQRGSEVFFDDAMRVRQQILTGTFPEYLLKQFAAMLDHFGQSPIIVRSSSLLEDAFGNSFVGKYESVFCANQGSPDKRMTDFLSAVRTVYASVMSDDALRYRAARGLLDADEQMALLVQRVSGVACGRRFFPHAAGVALSFNPYVWSDHIDPEAGVTRIVFGLGTRAVHRADDDYTRIVALNAPDRRPEAGSHEVRRYTQWKVDCLDLEANQEVTANFEQIVEENGSAVPLEMFASRDIEVERRAAEQHKKGVFSWVLTFDKLLKKTDFVLQMRTMLRTLEEAYGHPVDTEYTLNFFNNDQFKINLVQCRPLHVKGSTPISEPPESISTDAIILKTSGPVIGQSRIANIDRIIYVVRAEYNELPTYDRYAIARVIGKLAHLEGSQSCTTLLLGPGRWGTTIPALGVPVNFTEINTVDIICELVAMRDNLVPDVSLGTHFFNELVEMDMLYLACFPNANETILNQSLLEQAPNKLADYLPEEKAWDKVIRVIDVETLGKGNLVLNANAIKQRVTCYLEKNAS